MKKIISVLAMALLVIGAAQAHNQVRIMVVRTTDGEVTKFKTADIEDVTFEEVVIPTTVEEAKAMLVGYWRWCIPIEDDEDVEGVYYIIKEDLKALYCFKVKDSVTDEELAPYAGKYVAYEIGVVTFPSEEDPTTFYLGEEYNEGTNLHLNSFDFYNGSGDPDPCIRVDPFEYVIWMIF